MLHILRGLGSRSLQCGCFVGVYQTYAGAIVEILDERGPHCAEHSHRRGRLISPGDPGIGAPPSSASAVETRHANL